jgi:hypothetical protein
VLQTKHGGLKETLVLDLGPSGRNAVNEALNPVFIQIPADEPSTGRTEMGRGDHKPLSRLAMNRGLWARNRLSKLLVEAF